MKFQRFERIYRLYERARRSAGDPAAPIGIWRWARSLTFLPLLAKRPPCILFDHIKDYPPGFRVLTTVRNNRTAGRLIYGVDEHLDDDEAVQVWRERLKQYAPVPPVEVSSGPVIAERDCR